MKLSLFSAFVSAIALLTAALAVLLFTTAPCLAGWCPTYKCWAPCGNCACVSRDFSGGTCVDIDSVAQLTAQGWHELK